MSVRDDVAVVNVSLSRSLLWAVRIGVRLKEQCPAVWKTATFFLPTPPSSSSCFSQPVAQVAQQNLALILLLCRCWLVPEHGAAGFPRVL
jgi:hypothetical protein